MFETLAKTCYRRRRLMVGAWILLLVAATVLSGALGGELRNDFTLPGSPSQEASDLLEEGGFGGEAGHRGQVVVAADAGVDDPEVEAAVAPFLARMEDEVEGVTVRDPWTGTGGQVAPDSTAAIADVEFGDVDLAVAVERAEQIAEMRSAVAFPAGVDVELGGELFFEEAEFSSEGFGMLAAIAIMLVAFGSVLAAGLPVMTALFGIGCGIAIVMLFARVVDVPDFAPAAVTMVTIGVGIDYALFLVTRYREELAAGRDPEAAVVRAMETAGRAVLFAGTTVVIAMAGLFMVGVAATQALAVAISAGVAMVMLASLTLLPAVLGFVGPTIDRFSIRRRPSLPGGPGSPFHRWSRAVQRRPAPVAAVGLVVILVLSAPAASMQLGFSDAGNRPQEDTSRRAYDLVTESFGPGFNGPLFVVADLAGDEAADAAMLERVARVLDDEPGIAATTPVVRNGDGGVAVVQAFPATSPQDEATTDLVVRLRDEVLPGIEAPGTELLVGGGVAAVVDFAERESSRLPVFIGAVLVVSFLVLAVVFRAVVVALKAVVLNLLSISAAYGVVVAVFQWGWGSDLLGLGAPGPIEAWAPMMLFAILFGLSMDYEVFLLSRIKEEYDRSGDTASAVADGLARTARLITAAAAIMIFVFGGFVLSDERSLQIFGLGLAAAILVDVTIVRLLLVPSVMELLGDRNWWLPHFLARRLPAFASVPGDAEAGAGAGAASGEAEGLQRTPTLSGR